MQWLSLPCVIDVESQFSILCRVDADLSVATFVASNTNKICVTSFVFSQ